MNDKPDNMNAREVHEVLVRNLKGLESGEVSVDHANAVARLGNTIFAGVKTRLKVQTQAGQPVSEDLRNYAK